MARDAVAAGDGAFSTCIASASEAILKSSTMAPSASSAWARTPEGPNTSWSALTSGT